MINLHAYYLLHKFENIINFQKKKKKNFFTLYIYYIIMY
jgi:hypothetical protein